MFSNVLNYLFYIIIWWTDGQIERYKDNIDWARKKRAKKLRSRKLQENPEKWEKIRKNDKTTCET